MVLGYAVALVLSLWNRVVRAGRTGQSWGKKVLGQRLVGEATGAPLGAGRAFVRELARVIDSCFGLFIPLGHLWPLWDRKRQTWADMMVHSIVGDSARR